MERANSKNANNLCGIAMKDPFYKNVLKLFTGTIGSHIFWMLSMLTVARLYTPEYFGEGQLFIAAASIVSIIATGRYEAAIVVPRYRFQAMSLFFFSAVLSLLGAVLFFLLWLGFSDMLAGFTKIPTGSSMLLPLYTLELCIYVLCHAWLVRTKQYTAVVKGLVLFPACYLVLCTLFHFVWLPVHKLILAIMLARGAETLYYGYFMRKEIRDYLHRASWGHIWKYGKGYVDFPKYMLVGSFIGSAETNIIPFFITAFWGVGTTGYYSMATQCLAAPASLIAKSVGDVFRQEAGRLYGIYRECTAFYQKNLRLCIAYSAVICICAYVAVPTFVPLFLGEKWKIAGHYVQLMLPMTFMTLISSTMSIIYIVARRQGTYLGIQMANFLSSTIGIGVVGWLGETIETALTVWGVLIIIVAGVSIYGGKKIATGNIGQHDDRTSAGI